MGHGSPGVRPHSFGYGGMGPPPLTTPFSPHRHPGHHSPMPSSRHDAMRMDIGRLRYEYGDREDLAPSSPLASPVRTSLTSGTERFGTPSHLSLGTTGLEESAASPPGSPIFDPVGYRASIHTPHAKTVSPSGRLLGPPSGSSSEVGQLLDNRHFLDWLFLGLGSRSEDHKRLRTLEAMLDKLQDLKAVCIVLTNGFAADATRALRNLCLAQYFTAVCDTRGSIVRDPSSASAKPDAVHISGGGHGGRYSKRDFVSGGVFQPDSSMRWFGQPIQRVVYVDDDPEPLDPQRCHTIRLPKEGSGISGDTVFAILNAAEACQQGGQTLVIFDFDCTLSSRHMFKAMHQPTSKWAREWDAYAASQGVRTASRGGAVDITEKDGRR